MGSLWRDPSLRALAWLGCAGLMTGIGSHVWAVYCCAIGALTLWLARQLEEERRP